MVRLYLAISCVEFYSQSLTKDTLKEGAKYVKKMKKKT